jgi:hypothetical protein
MGLPVGYKRVRVQETAIINKAVSLTLSFYPRYSRVVMRRFKENKNRRGRSESSTQLSTSPTRFLLYLTSQFLVVFLSLT